MPYRIYSSYYKKDVGTAETWWDLITEIVKHEYLNSIAHTASDLLVYWRTDWYCDYPSKVIKTKQVEVFTRHIFIYDEFNRIINLNEIREGVKQYKEQPHRKWRAYYYRRSSYRFRYRVDPVPHTGKRHWGRYYRNDRHTYRNSYLSTLAAMPDPRLKEKLARGSDWGDEFPRAYQQNWKKQRKTQYK